VLSGLYTSRQSILTRSPSSFKTCMRLIPLTNRAKTISNANNKYLAHMPIFIRLTQFILFLLARMHADNQFLYGTSILTSSFSKWCPAFEDVCVKNCLNLTILVIKCY